MLEVVYLVIVAAFFAAAVGYVNLCARITSIDRAEGTPGGAIGEDLVAGSEVRS